MGVFARIAALIKSNLNDLINRSEDPEKMLNQVVIDMTLSSGRPRTRWPRRSPTKSG
jgi:phage shock protein A